MLPTIHLGSEANALENKGIHTERGDYNRKVMELRGLSKYINVMKGIAKWKFDKENRATLDAFPREIERLRKVISEGEKITPNAWRKEIDRIVYGQDPIQEKMAGEVYDLAFAEVLSFNKDNEEREHGNEIRQKEREQERSERPQRKHSYL